MLLDGVGFYPREHRGFGILPAHHGLTVSIVGWPHAEFHAFRIDIEGNLLKTLELAPALAERVRQGRPGRALGRVAGLELATRR